MFQEFNPDPDLPGETNEETGGGIEPIYLCPDCGRTLVAPRVVVPEQFHANGPMCVCPFCFGSLDDDDLID